jgi:hypothetical protein
MNWVLMHFHKMPKFTITRDSTHINGVSVEGWRFLVYPPIEDTANNRCRMYLAPDDAMAMQLLGYAVIYNGTD